MAANNSATDFDLEVLAIQSNLAGEFDLKFKFMELNIYEDLFQPFMSATIAVSDSGNIPLNLPILGDEVLNIQFKTAGMNDASLYFFKVYGISARKQIKPNQLVYVLDCVSENAFLNEQKKISKAYRNKKVSDIVSEMFSEIDKNNSNFEIETTSDTIDCIIPNWKPSDAIEWLSKRAIGGNGQSDFVFYENGGPKGSKENTMSFNSLQSLIQSGNDNSQSRLLMTLGGSETNKNKPNTVLSWYVDSSFNQIKNIRNGMYGSKLITYDHTLKTISEKNFDYFSSWKKDEHLENFPVMQDLNADGKSISTNNIKSANFGDVPEANLTVFPTHFQMFTYAQKNNKIDLWLQKRQSVMQQMNNYSIQVVVTGNSSFRVGQTVFLDLPSPEYAVETPDLPVLDKHYSGKFLITSIRHKLQRDGYEMILTLTKDSLQNPVLHSARKTN